MTFAKTSRRIFAGALLALLLGMATAAAEDTMQKYHHAKTSPKVDYAGMMAAATPLGDSPAGQAAIEECLAAYGGREALSSISGARLQYKRPGSKNSAADGVIKSFARGRRFRVDSGEQSRMIEGSRCWVTQGEQAQEMEGFRYRAELFSYIANTLPMSIERENFDEIRYGEGVSDQLDYLFMSKGDSMTVIVGFDREKHHIRSITGILPDEDTDIVYVNEFDDFRTVGGVVFPHKVAHISMGMKLGFIILENVDLNPGFASETFNRRKDDL